DDTFKHVHSLFMPQQLLLLNATRQTSVENVVELRERTKLMSWERRPTKKVDSKRHGIMSRNVVHAGRNPPNQTTQRYSTISYTKQAKIQLFNKSEKKFYRSFQKLNNAAGNGTPDKEEVHRFLSALWSVPLQDNQAAN
ncbi:hypothetical protein ILUMI_13238, partial [Ignelater luminosus]